MHTRLNPGFHLFGKRTLKSGFPMHFHGRQNTKTYISHPDEGISDPKSVWRCSMVRRTYLCMVMHKRTILRWVVFVLPGQSLPLQGKKSTLRIGLSAVCDRNQRSVCRCSRVLESVQKSTCGLVMHNRLNFGFHISGKGTLKSGFHMHLHGRQDTRTYITQPDEGDSSPKSMWRCSMVRKT